MIYNSTDTSSIHLVVTLQLGITKKEMTKKSKALKEAEEEVRTFYAGCERNALFTYTLFR